MRLLNLALVLSLIIPVNAATAPDEVDKAIMEGVPNNSIVWLNGQFRPINLPPDATPEKIAAEAIRLDSDNKSEQFAGYRIIQSKQVSFPVAPGPYTAILVSSARGSRTLILAQFESTGWWHRNFFITTVP